MSSSIAIITAGTKFSNDRAQNRRRTQTRSSRSSSKARIWTGRIMTAVPVAFLIFDTVVKFLDLDVVRESLVTLGYPVTYAIVIGTIELVCLTAYLVPRTSVLGAVLMTGYLGGAIATHVRVGSPLPSHVLFPIYVAVLLWGGLYLREDRLRALMPLRRRDHDVSEE